MRLEEEEVRAVALGTAWVAAATSLNFLRIFTEGGLQVCLLLNAEILILMLFYFVCTKLKMSLPILIYFLNCNTPEVLVILE